MKRIFLTTTLLLLAPTLVLAQQKYSPLVTIPGINDGTGKGSFGDYVNYLYAAAIAIGAFLAVIKIIIAGVKYMTTEVVNSKSDAKGEITGALLGLLLILGAYMVLNIVNPQLLSPGVNFQKIPEALPNQFPPPIATVDGKNQEQVSSALAQGLPACAKASGLGVAKSGLYTLDSINVDTCDAATKKTAQAIFAQNCVKGGGSLNSPNIYECKNAIAGAQQGKDFANNLSNINITNSNQALSADYIKTAGTITTVDVGAACDNNVKDLPAGQQKSQYTTCVSNLKVILTSRCEAGYGQYDGTNTSAVTCRVPKSVSDISTLTDAFTTWKNADPSGRKYETINNLSTEQEAAVCKTAGGTYKDITGPYNKCIFY